MNWRKSASRILATAALSLVCTGALAAANGSCSENSATPAVRATPATGGMPATRATPATPARKRAQETQIGPFTATYYNITTFVASEQVARPSINYPWSDFNSIPSPNFHAVWVGNIDVFNEPELIDINFDVSWSDVYLSVDGVQVAAWKNSNRSVTHEFTPGSHEVKVEYFNHWHTTGFDVSFTTNPTYTKDEAKNLFAPLIDADTQIIYVGSYESADRYNNSRVTLQNTANKVFLVLGTYNSLNWIIDNPNNVAITGIAYSSYSGVATVTADKAVPTFEIAGIGYGYEDFLKPVADIVYMTGRAPDHTYGAYALNHAIISVP